MKGHWEKGRYIIGNPRAASWSKWGGTRYGMDRGSNQHEILPEWSCQACSKKQLDSFPEYLLLLDDETREYIRICTTCKFRSVASNSQSFTKLRIEIQTRDIKSYLPTVSHLATLPIIP